MAFPQSLVCRILIAAATALCAGCQYQSISAARLEMHQSNLNKSGLTSLRVNPILKITYAPPELWVPLVPQENVLYSHQQWRSPDHQVGMGVAYAHTPVPISADMLIWFARAQYSKTQAAKGHVLGQWTDSLGRCWFEGENDKFHITGYAMTHGRDAWIVYSGYRLGGKASLNEIALAAKGADSVAPIPHDE
ncbi:MAG TPA: hypothetical protein VGG44_11870 [Tepidisphaeraceae bacterium]|jgi:hypothetical protein